MTNNYKNMFQIIGVLLIGLGLFLFFFCHTVPEHAGGGGKGGDAFVSGTGTAIGGKGGDGWGEKGENGRAIIGSQPLWGPGGGNGPAADRIETTR